MQRFMEHVINKTMNFSFSFEAYVRSPRIQLSPDPPDLTFWASRNDREKVCKKRSHFSSDAAEIVIAKAPYFLHVLKIWP